MEDAWSFLVGPTAGAGTPHARLLAHNVSLAECLAACQQPACAAVDYVQGRHASSSSGGGRPATVGAGGDPAGAPPHPPCEHTHEPARRSCFAVPANAWKHPCAHQQTENILAYRQPQKRPPAMALVGRS